MQTISLSCLFRALDQYYLRLQIHGLRCLKMGHFRGQIWTPFWDPFWDPFWPISGTPFYPNPCLEGPKRTTSLPYGPWEVPHFGPLSGQDPDI